MADDEWRIRAARGAKLLPDDPDGLRREYITELLKRNDAALAALDALGGKGYSTRRRPTSTLSASFTTWRASRNGQ